MTSHKFDHDYYENGVEKGISCYEDFHYIPERSIGEANIIKWMYGDVSVLDFGCAKGFLVHALRSIGLRAYGYDISEYAIENCLESISQFVSNNEMVKTEVLFCKDVLEHISEDNLWKVLQKFSTYKNIFVVVPFGEDDEYLIEDYEKDITHVLAKDKRWWSEMFLSNNLKIVDFTYKVDGLKDKWFEVNPYGNGFFKLEGRNA